MNMALMIFFHNAHGGRINQAAVVGNDGDNDERDLNAAVLHSDRQADFKNTAQHAFARAEVLAAQPQAGFVPPDAEQGNNNTQGLRKGSAQRSTHRAKGHGTDEKNIQRNIGGAGNGDKVHRALESPKPRKTELMMLYAEMNGMPMKQMVRYCTVPGTASAGTPIRPTSGRTAATSTVVKPRETAMNRVTVLPMAASASRILPAPRRGR